MSKVAYFDCPSGASGDMILAACLDAGLSIEFLREQISLLHLHDYQIETRMGLKMGVTARIFHVAVQHQHHHRTWGHIRELIVNSHLSVKTKNLAVQIFQRLAQAEARIHGVSVDQVHFHEVGAVDSIIDIVGAAVAWEYFDLKSAWVSPLPLGAGFVDTAHGRLPLPAPATLALLEGVPTYGTDLTSELITPTGIAILATLATGFGPRPAMTIEITGYGAGTRDLPDRPNILRLTLGRIETEIGSETLVVGETNVDDMNPEIWPFILERLLLAGALDVWLTPIQMKKGRPAVTLSFLARPTEETELCRILFQESTTLGIRTHEVRRAALKRTTATVTTPWGDLPVKKIFRDSRIELVPEYEACRKMALDSGLPLREIYEMVRSTKDQEEPG
ncbi:MAG: nickel pincer cofactor biosynthesis protein LarC [Deltaproteobacteria bacterium]|nr:nickel pincer cofactor biosynthesis protein LarC [Deltaproteobacteria bacterium]